ncbi:MAG TPA: hypothetical protein VG498_24065 [Terriglobales bacterium]|nr:hypothetical protein [Terriglobales bacterium]
MTKEILQIAALLLCLAVSASAQSTTKTENSAIGPQLVHPNPDTQGLKSDLERMHIVLEQMQRNVAFVSSGDSPLKHQFQLEIEMWQLLIRDMERKTAAQETR